MSDEKNVVITVYGHNESIDKFAVKMMIDNDAEFYCDAINNLKLNGDSWVYAKIISENSQYSLEDFRPVTFDLILCLDDRAIQKVLRETDAQDLAKALRGAAPEIAERIYRNMSRRAVVMLNEDIEFMGPQPVEDVKAAQEKILNVIRNLEETGEIIAKKEFI